MSPHTFPLSMIKLGGVVFLVVPASASHSGTYASISLGSVGKFSVTLRVSRGSSSRGSAYCTNNIFVGRPRIGASIDGVKKVLKLCRLNISRYNGYVH